MLCTLDLDSLSEVVIADIEAKYGDGNRETEHTEAAATIDCLAHEAPSD